MPKSGIPASLVIIIAVGVICICGLLGLAMNYL